MADDLVDGIERATFGAVPVAVVDAWLRRHVRERLSTARERPFTGEEQVTAAAAVVWTMTYDARCLVDVAAMGLPVPEGSTLDALAEHGDDHLALRW